MDKDPPPPYSSIGAPPPPGFHIAPTQVPPNQPLGFQSTQQGYYTPAPGHPPAVYGPPPMQQGGTTVVVTTVPVISRLGPYPQALTCPHCHNLITSRVEFEVDMKTHLFALLLCLFGCIPCCLLPYCMESCQNKNHYCPSCGAFLGTFNSDSLARR